MQSCYPSIHPSRQAFRIGFGQCYFSWPTAALPVPISSTVTFSSLFISVHTPPLSFLLVKIQAFDQDLMHIQLVQDILFSLLTLPETLCLLRSNAANVGTESSPTVSEALW